MTASRLLCIAIPVPDPWGGQVDAARRLLQPDRRHMAAHITLIPPFRTSEHSLAGVLARTLEAIGAFDPFVVRLRGTATFEGGSATGAGPSVPGATTESRPVVARATTESRPVVARATTVFIPVVAGAAQCASLRAALATALDRVVGLPMVPHVTIANRADPGTMERALRSFAGFCAEFAVGRVCVYELGEGGWSVIRAADTGGTAASHAGPDGRR